ncbi:MAG: cytochrome c biogenesis protein [Pirellulales bacterium]
MKSRLPGNAVEARLRANGVLGRVLAVLSSPRITGILVLAAIGIIMVGTLAQVQMDLWEIVHDYFRAWVCWVDLKVLFPISFFPWAAQTNWDSLSIHRFPYPGGALIGLALTINLAAALAVRFPVKARGARLAWGLLVLAAGVATTWFVIALGHNRHGLQGKPPLEWSRLWVLIRIGLAGLWLASVFGLLRVFRSGRRERNAELAILAACTLGLSGLLAWIFARGEAVVLADASLRILYQLIQGELAALVLLGACFLLYRNRAGGVLLHGGVALLMFGEFFVSQFAEEQQMTLLEGQAVGYTRDTRSVDLAVSKLLGNHNAVLALPMETQGKIVGSALGGKLEFDDLPFRVEVIRYYKNSTLRMATPQEPNPNLATHGVGTRVVAEEAPPKSSVGRESADLASAYVKLTGKEQGEDLGTYLVSQHLPPLRHELNAVAVRGGRYSLELRYKRSDKPYQITLLDVRKDDYVGTGMARNYSSRVRLTDSSRNVDFEAKIWMNNPLRYAGETFYQSGYHIDPGGKESSTLQVVKNTGWMIPYVSCMIVATGMLWHFLRVLLRFLRRTPSDLEAAGPVDRSGGPARPEPKRRFELLVPSAVVLLGVAWVAYWAAPSRPSGDEMQWEQFGTLPVMDEGRIKPLDTLARTSLRIISGRETFVDDEGNTQPAIRWLLDVIARPEVAEKHRVFRIESAELRDTLGLERRKGNCFAWAEIRPDSIQFQRLAVLAEQQDSGQRAFQQKKLLDLAQRVNRYRLLADAFRPLPPPPALAQGTTAANSDATAETAAAIEQLKKEIPKRNGVLQSMQLPLAAPAGPAGQPWLAYAVARNDARAIQLSHHGEPAPATMKLAAIFEAYGQGRVQAFNEAVAAYETLLADEPPAGLNSRITRFEAYSNRFAPFYNSIPLYALALVLTLGSWLAAAMSRRWSALLRSSAFWLIVMTFAVHTFALAARVVISGRPPVTNLYSSAVFIGWGCVAIGLVMEMVFRLGLGNLVSSVAGIGTLIIAHLLAADGDTIRVLQAVLDTQFWLTAHVLTITLGYAAMFLAGLLGLVSIAYMLASAAAFSVGQRRGLRGPQRLPDERSSPFSLSRTEQILGSMIYGSICFAAFFSLVGTVLGGLWADDSWGRFWGWDPKENGALIIVLWTALVLHARSARMAGPRGLAILAVGGNIVTSWSWFGVNELGVGLHAYGSAEGVGNALLVFWCSQLLIIGLAVLPVLLARLFVRPSKWSLRKRV